MRINKAGFVAVLGLSAALTFASCADDEADPVDDTTPPATEVVIATESPTATTTTAGTATPASSPADAEGEDAIRARLEELVAFVADEVGYDGPVDFSPPWRRVTLRDAIKEKTGIDITGDDVPGEGTWAKRVDALLSKQVEPDLVNPTFVLDYPKELSPFAKDHRSEEGLVERFECFAAGMEFANAFTELNDPDEQRARFEQQRADEAAGDEETQPYDEDYVAALEYGMPPTGGIGIGIDRLVMILSGRHGIREVVLFPAMRN